MVLLTVFLVSLYIYSLLSKRLAGMAITGPIYFTTVGIITGYLDPEIFKADPYRESLLIMAEIGLVFLLFTDSSRIDLSILRKVGALPVRLLSTGMLLTIAMGALIAKLVFPELSYWEAGILSAILAPTDAGLGQVIVTSENVPLKVRQALNVEAGLNDGLSVPFMLFFVALATFGLDHNSASLEHFIWQQLGIGAIIGILVGTIGGRLLLIANKGHNLSSQNLQIAVMTLPLLCLPLCELTEASMFIAAFFAGLAVQIGYKEVGEHSVEFAEDWGQVINQSVFFLFGITIASHWNELSATAFVYGALSLTIIRIIPVALSLIGTGLARSTVLFIGWFGPRGLASIVLGLVYQQQERLLPGESLIRAAVMATVLMSIYLHGLSAQPLINYYNRAVRRLPQTAPENG